MKFELKSCRAVHVQKQSASWYDLGGCKNRNQDSLSGFATTDRDLHKTSGFKPPSRQLWRGVAGGIANRLS